MGAPYVPVLGLAGSDLLRGREDMKIQPDPFDPTVQTVVARAYRPEVALLHAQKADRAGNVAIGYHSEDTIIAEASRTVIVTVEELVDSLPESEANGTYLPSILVDAVVHAPWGAHPAGCPGYYPPDQNHLDRYLLAAGSDEAFAEYLNETVFSVASHAEYVSRFVPGAGRGTRGPAGQPPGPTP